MRPLRAQLRRVAPVGGQRSAFEDGAAGPDQAGDRRDALSQGGRAVRPLRNNIALPSFRKGQACGDQATDERSR